MRDARVILVISRFLQNYLWEHARLSSHVCTLPFFGAGPFPNVARFDRGFVTMINPCELKGVSIFLALAQEFPDVNFAVVPTWGATDTILRQLRQRPNITILKPADNIDEIFDQTRVLLVPSLWPETFGYVVPEAMLRGIPVLASALGGLPEAKLGVDYLLPVQPAQRTNDGFVSPPQDTIPWSRTLGQLLQDPVEYQRCSMQSHAAALKFVAAARYASVETFLAEWSTP
jgi:glycosyltransferase involved in cell wall biosynthesis